MKIKLKNAGFLSRRLTKNVQIQSLERVSPRSALIVCEEVNE